MIIVATYVRPTKNKVNLGFFLLLWFIFAYVFDIISQIVCNLPDILPAVIVLAGIEFALIGMVSKFNRASPGVLVVMLVALALVNFYLLDWLCAIQQQEIVLYNFDLTSPFDGVLIYTFAIIASESLMVSAFPALLFLLKLK